MIIWESFHEYFSISKSDYYCHLGVTVVLDPKRCFDLFWSKFKKVLSVMTWIKANLMKKCGHQDSIIWRTMNLKIIFGREWNDNCTGIFLDISLVLSSVTDIFGIDLTYKTWLHVSYFCLNCQWSPYNVKAPSKITLIFNFLKNVKLPEIYRKREVTIFWLEGILYHYWGI